jgi:hypothetical protein
MRPSNGIKKHSRLVGALALFALSGAACEGVDGETENNQAALGVEDIATGALSAAAGKATDWWINSLLGIDPAADLQRNFDDIKWALDNLASQVENLTFDTMRWETNAVSRDAANDRANVIHEALRFAPGQPWLADGYMRGAWSAADKWFQDPNYTFVGMNTSVTNPTRFDPRIAAPTAIEAVNTYIVMRGLAAKYAQGGQPVPIDDNMRNDLRTFAQNLDWRVQQIKGAVRCEERRNLVSQKRDGHAVRTGCNYFYYCEDKIAESFVYDKPMRHVNVPCDSATTYRAADSAAAYKKYSPDAYHAIAETWRALANR